MRGPRPAIVTYLATGAVVLALPGAAICSANARITLGATGARGITRTVRIGTVDHTVAIVIDTVRAVLGRWHAAVRRTSADIFARRPVTEGIAA